MIFVKVKDGEIEKFPYTMGNLQTDHPNVSFPVNPSSEILEPYSTYQVFYHPFPLFDERTHTINVAQIPVLIDDVWTMTRKLIAKTPEEIEAYDAEALATLRTRLTNEIDDRTGNLIVYGCVYLGKRVRLNLEDQNNFEGEYSMIKDYIVDGVPEQYIFPTVFKIWTYADGRPDFIKFTNVSDMKNFIYSGKIHIKNCLIAGWDLKDAMSKLSLNELKAWTDPRPEVTSV